MNKTESKVTNKCYCLEAGSHIAEFNKGLLEKVLNGKKRFDSRFSKEKCIPYDSINDGDTIYLKEENGPIVARAIADNIKFYANLNDEKIRIFKYNYGSILLMDNEFWDREKDSQYATFFALKNVQDIQPIQVNETVHSSWFVVEEKDLYCDCRDLL